MQRDRIIYVYDALCGWCYGFSPVIEQVYERYGQELDFEVISGGMITGERIGPIGKVAPYISWAYKEVENRTGVQFGKGFLEGVLREGTAVFSSIKPAVALSVFKTYHPEQAVAFAGTLQKAIYYDGLQPENLADYGPYAETYGIAADEFVARMQEDHYYQAARKDFEKASALGVTGFPTVFFGRENKLWVLARGYVPFQTLDRTIQTLKAELV